MFSNFHNLPSYILLTKYVIFQEVLRLIFDSNQPIQKRFNEIQNQKPLQLCYIEQKRVDIGARFEKNSSIFLYSISFHLAARYFILVRAFCVQPD